MEEEFEYMDVETINIPLEDGSEMECAILDEFEAEGHKYMVLAPIEGDEIGEDTFMYRYEEDGDDLIMDYIDDQDELDRVSKIYAEMTSEFEDEE